MIKALFLTAKKYNIASIVVLIVFFVLGCATQEAQLSDLQVRKAPDSCEVVIRNLIVQHSPQNRFLHSWAYDFQAMNGQIYYIGQDTNLILIDIPSGAERKMAMPNFLFQQLKVQDPYIKIYPSIQDSIVVFLSKTMVYTWYYLKKDSFRIIPVEQLGLNTKIFSIQSYEGSGFQAMQRGNFIGIPVVQISPKGKKKVEEGATRGYEIELDLKKQKVNYRYLDFPDLLNDYKYGFLSETYRIKLGDTNIVSFAFTGDIYIEHNNYTSVVGGKSKFQKNPNIKPLERKYSRKAVSYDSFWYYYTHNDYYTSMAYNPNNGFFARFYVKPLGAKIPNSDLYYTSEDKVFILQIFNKNLELMYENPVKGLNFLYYLIPYKNGFITNWNALKSGMTAHNYKYYEIR